MRTTSPEHSGPAVPAEDVADTTKTRRSFIFFGSLAGVGALAPRSLRAQRPKRRVLPPNGDPREAASFQSTVPALPEWVIPEARLVRRVTNGITSDDVAQALSQSYQGYLENQLHHTQIDDSAVETFVNSRSSPVDRAMAWSRASRTCSRRCRRVSIFAWTAESSSLRCR